MKKYRIIHIKGVIRDLDRTVEDEQVTELIKYLLNSMSSESIITIQREDYFKEWPKEWEIFSYDQTTFSGSTLCDKDEPEIGKIVSDSSEEILEQPKIKNKRKKRKERKNSCREKYRPLNDP